MKIPYKWIFKENYKNIDYSKLSKKFNISEKIIKLLLNRGYDTEEKIKKFLFSDLFYLKNPFLFADMYKSVEILRKHIEKNSKILIWGDRDLDGITSVVIFYTVLKKFTKNVIWYIPQNEGYGLNLETLEKFVKEINLIITVDCGITALGEIKFMVKNNIDVIITDHHEPDENKVKEIRKLGVPVINPYLQDYKEFKELAGVAVALKLITALFISYDNEIYNKEFVILDIETTGLLPTVDEICEIAALKVKNFSIIDTFYTLVKPDKDIPENVTKIHGITNELVKNSPKIKDVIPKLLNFIDKNSIIFHNADFDLNFIDFVLKNLGLEVLSSKNKIIDTLKLAKEYLPINSHSLKSLSDYFSFENQPNHRAYQDALATYELYYYLYIIKNKKLNFFIKELLPFVSLGTLSDIVPLIEENRIIVKNGIQEFIDSNHPVILQLKQYLSDKKIENIDADSIIWHIVPLLNSAGRMRQVEIAVNFLTSQNSEEAEKYFLKLLELNDKRKFLQNNNYLIFYEYIEQQCDLKNDIILLVTAENLEHGVTGIIANRLLNEFNRPIILLIVENGIAKGTARSPKNINIYSILKKYEYLFEKFGGHENACGLTIKKENIPLLREELKKVEKDLEQITPKLEIDLELEPSDLTYDFYKELFLLEPFGPENNYPVFLLRNQKVINWKNFGKNNNHISLTLKGNSKKEINAIFWDSPEIIDLLKNFLYFNVVGEIELDTQQNNIIRFIILDIQPVITL
ncbi:MAG: single-stranded-DNA-specific exonuclease RecJ [Endomicrobia bacterium]|nr:single-stranded-DNA-specific exonuclease RecJ [Endomicrobiia bacterium]